MAAVTHVKNKFAAATSNGTATVTIFTHGTGLLDPTGDASGMGGILDRITIFNSDTIQHLVYIFRVPSGGSAASANRIETITLPTVTSYVLEGPFYSADSAFYQVILGESHSSTAVFLQAYYHEFT